MHRGEVCPHGNLELDHTALQDVVIAKSKYCFGLPDSDDTL